MRLSLQGGQTAPTIQSQTCIKATRSQSLDKLLGSGFHEYVNQNGLQIDFWKDIYAPRERATQREKFYELKKNI